MASIQYRTSRGKKYWSIVESRRINGKPRSIILEYLGTPTTLLKRLQGKEKFSLKSYSHGDVSALLNIATELDVIHIINKYIPAEKNNKKFKRDGLTVGASFLLAAIGRACKPTSKLGWYEWNKTTSLEYCLKRSFKKLDSRHFWDQMHALPLEAISCIEKELILKLIEKYKIKMDCLLFDTTNFFTFINSTNQNCDIPQRGRNKQKRYDLRQVGMALLVTKKNQFPLFHKTYRGNKNDVTLFKDILNDLINRLKQLTTELSDITLVFDKGNNSIKNFEKLDNAEIKFVAGLVSTHFHSLLQEADGNFDTINIRGENIPVYRTKHKVWGQSRTCVVIVSKQLKEGQIRGIYQGLEKKCTELANFKHKLENPRKRKEFTKEDIEKKLNELSRGQFIQEILKYELLKLPNKEWSFTYFIDLVAFENLKSNILGKRILVTNRNEWTNREIILSYRGQSKVEYAFRTMKNPYHLAIRPQYHWTDQKIETHFLICIIGYLLAVGAYTKGREAGYEKNINQFLNDLKNVRLACIIKPRGQKIKFLIETVPKELKKILKALNVTDKTIRQDINFSDYD